MSALIPNQVKTNMYFSLYETLFLVCTNLYVTVYHVYNNNYNNNYSSIIYLCLQPLCQPHLYVILLIRLFVILLTTFFVSANFYSLDLHHPQKRSLT